MRVTVVSSIDGSLLANAQVTGTFNSLVPQKSGWPLTSTALTSNLQGANLGVASFKSNNLSSTKGNGCSFAVNDVQLAGYQLDPNAPLLGPTATW